MAEEPVPQVTPQVAQRVWMHSAKSQTKQANAGKQCRGIYDTALAHLHQQREIVRVGATTKLLSRRQLVVGMRATIAQGEENSSGGGRHQGCPGEGCGG